MKVYNTKYEEFKIRTTTVDDTDLIFKFVLELAEYENLTNEVKATRESIKKNIFQYRRAEALIAEENGNPIGYSLFFYNFSTFEGKPTIYLEDIFIRKECRGKGYGTEIFKVLARIAAENDCGRFEWTCLNWNEPSLKFYKAMGGNRRDDWVLHRMEKDEISKLVNSK